MMWRWDKDGDEAGGVGDDTGEGGADKSAAYSSSPVHHDGHQREILYATASPINFKLHSWCDGGQKACNANSVHCIGFETERCEAYLRPHINGLRVHQILAEVRAQFEIDKYMLDFSGDKLPDREFVIIVGKAFNYSNNSTVNTLIPDLLQDMIERALEAREVKYISRRNIKMRILPELKNVRRNKGGLQ